MEVRCVSKGLTRSASVTFSEEMEEREDEENSSRDQLDGEVNCRCFSCPFCQSSQSELHVSSSY